MGFSCRIFLLDRDDVPYRVPVTKFYQMLCNPRTHRLPQFAGTRLRTTEVTVKLVNREAIGIAHIAFGFFTVDSKGYFDRKAFERHQRASVDLLMDRVLAKPSPSEKIVDASSLFAVQGGRWTPSKSLEHRIHEVALGRVKCARL
jgi:hypothetical protein